MDLIELKSEFDSSDCDESSSERVNIWADRGSNSERDRKERDNDVSDPTRILCSCQEFEGVNGRKFTAVIEEILCGAKSAEDFGAI